MGHWRRLLQGATALLYLGPLLAGLGGFGPELLPPFVLAFMVWLVMLRPGRWPQSFVEWMRPVSLLAGVTLILTQTLFVALLFGVGRGIGGVLGVLPAWHPLLPLLLSLTALPVLRLVRARDLALYADAISGQASRIGPPWIGDEIRIAGARLTARPIGPAAEVAVAELLAQASTGVARVEAALGRFYDSGDLWSRFAALADALRASPGSAHRELRRAVILKATGPQTSRDFILPGEIGLAFVAAGNCPDLLDLLARRGRMLLHQMPDAVPCFPSRNDIQDLAVGCGDAVTAQALCALAAVLPVIRPADEAGGRGQAFSGSVRSAPPPSARGA